MNPEPTTKNLEPEIWEMLLKVCINCKSLFLLKQLMEAQNEPQDLGAIDKMLKMTSSFATRSRLYPSRNAFQSLNGYLSRASIPYRIKQITYGANCYCGTIQVQQHKSKTKSEGEKSVDEIKLEFEKHVNQITNDPEKRIVLTKEFQSIYIILSQGEDEIKSFLKKFVRRGELPTNAELTRFVSNMQHCVGTTMGHVLYKLPRHLKS